MGEDPGNGGAVTAEQKSAEQLRGEIAQTRSELGETAAALSPEDRTAYEISLDVFGTELGPTQRRFAVAETLSHLERLVREGRAARAGDGGTVTYTAP